MIARILAFSVHQRWLVALLTVAAAAFGGWSMTKLPIDAVRGRDLPVIVEIGGAALLALSL